MERVIDAMKKKLKEQEESYKDQIEDMTSNYDQQIKSMN